MCCAGLRRVFYCLLGRRDGMDESGCECGLAAFVYGYHFRETRPRLFGYELDQVGVLAPNEEEAGAVARAQYGVSEAQQRRLEGALPAEDCSFEIDCGDVSVVSSNRVSDEGS